MTSKNCDVIFKCAFSVTFQMKNRCHKMLFTISLSFFDFMISVTYFALENIALSKVDVHQDQGDQHEDGQGQVR